MADRPTGILSLTYHLVNDDDLTQRWQDPIEYQAILQEFGISAEDVAKLNAINALINGQASAQEIVNAWVELLRPELLVAREDLW